MDDASSVNKTQHGGVFSLSDDLNTSIELIREALFQAKIGNLKIMPMGARHSMGKQAFQRGAILLNTLSMNNIEMDGVFFDPERCKEPNPSDLKSLQFSLLIPLPGII